jgi:hypothetical protein
MKEGAKDLPGVSKIEKGKKEKKKSPEDMWKDWISLVLLMLCFNVSLSEQHPDNSRTAAFAALHSAFRSPVLRHINTCPVSFSGTRLTESACKLGIHDISKKCWKSGIRPNRAQVCAQGHGLLTKVALFINMY